MRIEQLTFTRFIAAILIVIFHYGTEVFPFNLEKTMFLGSDVGVSYFFILSGFVMIIAYHKREKISAIRYLQNRFARIYPVYLFALVIFIAYLLLATNAKVDLGEVALNTTMLQAWIPGQALTLNFPAWSLSVELFFYLSFPILFNLIYRKFDFKKLIIPFVLFFVISQVALIYLNYSDFNKGIHTTSHDFLFYFPLMHFNEFLIGNLVGLYFVGRKEHKTRNYAIPILAIIVATGLLLSYTEAIIYHNGLLAILFVPLILMISLDHSFIAKFSKSKLMVHLGEISYGVYILQVPIFYITRRALMAVGITDKTQIFYIYLVVLLISSSIIYRFLEAPLRKKIKNLKLVSAKK